jgi:uncharacterized repeat protein (TIGR01451 family)
MKKSVLTGVSALTGVVLAVAVTTPVFAWHPEGRIKKFVQNQTTNGELKDANTVQDAVDAKPGDVLKYVIEVSNSGKSDSKGWNDMHFTVLKDTLPAGVELVSNSSQRQITENLGVLKPGQKVTKTYLVKVTSDKDEDVITNRACFTGDSEVKDNKQSGCDDAVVKTDVPEKPEQPEEPEEPAKGHVLPATLPETGAGSIAGAFTGFTAFGYAAHRLVTRKRK